MLTAIVKDHLLKIYFMYIGGLKYGCVYHAFGIDKTPLLYCTAEPQLPPHIRGSYLGGLARGISRSVVHEATNCANFKEIPTELNEYHNIIRSPQGRPGILQMKVPSWETVRYTFFDRVNTRKQ